MSEILMRVWQNLIGRLEGPLNLRLIIQPAVAAVLAIRAGLRDARQNRPPFIRALLLNRADRGGLLRQGWNDVGKVFIVAAILDIIYQLIVHRGVYLLELLITAVALAIVPYALIRSLVNRIARMASGRVVSRIKKRSLVLLLLTAMGAIAADRPDLPPVLTLPQALDMALKNSTNIRTAMAQLEQAKGQYLQYRSSLLPQLDLHARQSLLTVNLVGLGVPVIGETGKIGPFGSMDARIFLTQELFNLADRRAWQSARWRQNSARFMVEDARELVALNVVAAYLEALRNKASRDSLAAQGTLAGDLYKITRERVTQGVAAELEANRAMQQVNSLEQQRLEAAQTYVTAKLNLANILQAKVTSNYEVADPAAYGAGGPPDRVATIRAALASRADYLSLEANVKAAELGVKSAKASRLPTLSMGFSDGQSGNSPEHNVNVYSLSGFVDFPIFDGGFIHGEIEEAKGVLREALAALDQSRSQIETDVMASISGVESALKEVATSEANVKLSQQEVELARQRFTQGIADNTEVVNAQDRLERAADARIRAEFNLGLARADLARASGVAEKTYRR